MSHSIIAQLSVRRRRQMFPCMRACLVRLCVEVCDISVRRCSYKSSAALCMTSRLCPSYSFSKDEGKHHEWTYPDLMRRVFESLKKYTCQTITFRGNCKKDVHWVAFTFTRLNWTWDFYFYFQPHLLTHTGTHTVELRGAVEASRNVIRFWRWRCRCN